MTHSLPAHRYAVEEWTDQEAEILCRYFTNLDGPVFALVNLPEVVKGALFARYSRSSKSLRRLFLDEFVGDLDLSGDHGVDATVGLARAEQLYDRVFFEYGDDSVAQLGGVHLACEQASNLLTKILERGRLMAYLEQSTRYIAYDSRLPNGRYRYHRDPAVLDSPLGARYIGDMDRIFDSYASLLPVVGAWLGHHHPRRPADSDMVWRRAVRAKSFDALRGMLPAGASSNVGIYGSGQAYEALLVRMQASPLPEARAYARLMHAELAKVIPSWVKRVDVADRGQAWSAYLEHNAATMSAVAGRLLAGREPGEGEPGEGPTVRLLDWDPDAEAKVVTAMLVPYSHLSESAVAERVAAMTTEERLGVVRAYAGDRTNRRQRPGRALERVGYRFEILSDYGAFRDLQRHRMLTVDWQHLTPHHGYTRPDAVEAAGAGDAYDAAMERSASLFEALDAELGAQQAGYAVALAYRIRYHLQLNAREAMHLIELRTGVQGHPEYRQVGQAMHRLIAEQAGHRVIAAMMSFADHTAGDGDGLERLAGERRAQVRRARGSERARPAAADRQG